MEYTCSLCQAKVSGDVVTFTDHTEQHIVDLIKHDHPDWAGSDGVCRKCYEYYKQELAGSIFKDAPCAIRLRRIKEFFSSLTRLFKKK